MRPAGGKPNQKQGDAKGKDKKDNAENDINKELALSLSVTVGESLRSFPSPSIKVKRDAFPATTGSPSPTTAMQKSKKGLTQQAPTEGYPSADGGEGEEGGEGDVLPALGTLTAGSGERFSIVAAKPTASQRRSTIRLQQQKLSEDLANAKEKEKVGTIHGSYLNNASDLLLSFSSNELSSRDITEDRRKSVTPTTHLQKLAKTNSEVKSALTITIGKSESAGVEIERKDVTLGSPIVDPRGLIKVGDESNLVLGTNEGDKSLGGGGDDEIRLPSAVTAIPFQR